MIICVILSHLENFPSPCYNGRRNRQDGYAEITQNTLTLRSNGDTWCVLVCFGERSSVGKKARKKHVAASIERNYVHHGGEQGIRTLEATLIAYTISNRAPSASSDNSPCLAKLQSLCNFLAPPHRQQEKLYRVVLENARIIYILFLL